MEIGRLKSRWEIKVFENLKNGKRKSKGFIIRDIKDIKNIDELADLVKKLLKEHYNQKKLNNDLNGN